MLISYGAVLVAGLMPVVCVMVGQNFGSAAFGRIMGLVIPFFSLAAAAGPVLSGAVRDQAGNYDYAFVLYLPGMALAAQLDVQHGRVKALVNQGAERVSDRVRRHHVITGLAEHFDEQPGHVDLVFHDQNNATRRGDAHTTVHGVFTEGVVDPVPADVNAAPSCVTSPLTEACGQRVR